MAYTKQTWIDGEVITAEKLNHIEDGLENAGGGGAFVVNVAYDQNARTATADKTAAEIYNAAQSGLVNFVVAYAEDPYTLTDVCALTMASRGEEDGYDEAFYAFTFAFSNGQISVLLTAEGDNIDPVGLVE